MSSRLRLRRQLKCRDFSWYLSNVWPEHFFPTQGRRLGSLRLLDTDLCVQTPRRDLNAGSNQPSGAAILEECAAVDFYTPQLLVVTEHEKNVTGRLIMADESVCLDAPAAGQTAQATVRFQACTGEARQRWRVNEGSLAVVHAESGRCLTRPDGGTSDALVVQECLDGGDRQQWHLDDRRWREPSGAAGGNDDIL